MKDHFKQLFKYDKWANQQLLDLFERQFPVNPRIYELFSHTLSAQRLWLDRILGLPQSVTIWGQERIPAEMKEDNENYNLAWLDFIEELQPEDFERMVHYNSSKGDPFDNRLADIIMHVINHATHHRGGIVTLMKEEGFVLRYLDYIAFVRMV
jgi:uncharacterized damage-inducible protein DinB